MIRWMPAATALWLLCSTPAAMAQHSGSSPSMPGATAPAEATQFDFLIGHWELEITPKVSGLAAAIHGAPRLVGSWKAWRALDGYGITDELRVVDASGNPQGLSHAVRFYDAGTRQWQMQLLDVYRARLSTATARWASGEMLATSSSMSPEGKPMLTRTRFFEIGPDRFRMRQDRSSDNGASWDEGTLNIVAKRLARVAVR